MGDGPHAAVVVFLGDLVEGTGDQRSVRVIEGVHRKGKRADAKPARCVPECRAKLWTAVKAKARHRFGNGGRLSWILFPITKEARIDASRGYGTSK